MTVRVYLSTDAGAPVLSGSVGSRIAVLKACLVTGYGSQASLGWTEEFTGTNLSVLRPPQGNRHYFRFDDTVAQSVSVRGYLTMSAVSTGTGVFPTTGSGAFMVASSVADASARPWIVVADEKTAYFVSAYDTNTSWVNAQILSFGEFVKFNAAWPALNSYVWGTATATTSSQGFSISNSPTATVGGFFTSMNVDGSQNSLGSRRRGSLNIGRLEGQTASTMSGHIGTSIPSLSTGGLLTSPIGVYSTVSALSNGELFTFLGTFRGLREFLHNRPLNNLDTINGSGDMAGRTFVAVNGGVGDAQVLFETSNTWE